MKILFMGIFYDLGRLHLCTRILNRETSTWEPPIFNSIDLKDAGLAGAYSTISLRLKGVFQAHVLIEMYDDGEDLGNVLTARLPDYAFIETVSAREWRHPIEKAFKRYDSVDSFWEYYKRLFCSDKYTGMPDPETRNDKANRNRPNEYKVVGFCLTEHCISEWRREKTRVFKPGKTVEGKTEVSLFPGTGLTGKPSRKKKRFVHE